SDDTLPAHDMFARAIEIDPNFARAHAFLAWAQLEILWSEVWTLEPRDAARRLEQALVTAQRAVTLDGNDALCHWSLAYVHFARKAFGLAADHLDLAITLNPSDAESLAHRAILEAFTGRPEQALQSIRQARAFNPVPPNYYWDA